MEKKTIAFRRADCSALKDALRGMVMVYEELKKIYPEEYKTWTLEELNEKALQHIQRNCPIEVVFVNKESLYK